MLGRPHSFIQYVEGERLLEQDLRSDAEGASRGEIVDAAYLERPRAHWFWRWIHGTPPPVRLRAPFTEEGADALKLWRRVPAVSEESAPGRCVRLAAGRARGLGPRGSSDDALFTDLWVLGASRTWRVCEGRDFVIVPQEGPGVVISYGLAPLVIARPRWCTVSERLERLHPRTQALVDDALPRGGGWTLRLEEDDHVEVLGVPRPWAQSARARPLDRVGTPYRGYRPPDLVMGDEDGTRLVLRISR